MATASITVEKVDRDASYLILEDTSDYTAVSVDKTDLEITDPNGVVYNVNIFDENFGSISSIYNIEPSLLGLTKENFIDGVYKFVFTATLDTLDVLISSPVYLLMDINSKICWSNMFEDAIDDGDDVMTDREILKRREVREMIQASEEHFNQSRYISASNLLIASTFLCESNCTQ